MRGSDADLPYADEEAARAGDFIGAVTLKLDAMAEGAVETLASVGAFDVFFRNLGGWAVKNSRVPPSELFDELIDGREGFYAVAARGALDFADGKDVPSSDQPWPLEWVAAHILLDVYMFGNRVSALRRRLVIDKALDLVGTAELIWIAMRVGAMSEAFRPGPRDMAARLAEADRLLEAQRVARHDGTATQKSKAAAWQAKALPVAQRARREDPWIPQERVITAIRAGVTKEFNAPLERPGGEAPKVVKVKIPASDSRIRSVISNWEKEWRDSNGERGLEPRRSEPRLEP